MIKTFKPKNMIQSKLLRSLLSILFLSAFSFAANANHLIGGQITYTCTSGSTHHVKVSVIEIVMVLASVPAESGILILIMILIRLARLCGD
ncbi:hypothetical protein EMGBS15_08520 [Filimonas sp.]|nr:hypothetical protein EMGBS15_08520 [Filimonas sp.]